MPHPALILVGVALLGLMTVLWFSMRPRRFYFLRHGETMLNAQRIRQGADGGLSAAGQAQAERAGAYLAHFRISRILASTYERSRETAEIIRKRLGVPVTYSELLVERKNPSEIVGRSADDPDVKHIVDQVDLAYHEDSYRYSDEENFIDLKRRAKRVLRYLKEQKGREICVVTHGIFLKMLVAYLLYRERLSADDYVKLAFFNASDNANITICEFHPWKIFTPTRGWEVVSYDETP